MIRQWLHLTAILLLIAITSSFGAAKSDGPKIATKELETEPLMPFYFENSDTILFLSPATGEVYESFDGGVEWKVLGKEGGDGKEGDTADMANAAILIQPHPFDNQKAYILGRHGIHWVTTDQGKTWHPFEIHASPSLFNEPLKFHGEDSKKVIFQGEQCSAFACMEIAFYTLDDFETVSMLRDSSRGCLWAVSTPGFADSTADVAGDISNRVFCVVHGLKNPFASAYRLVYSDEFFEDDEDGIEANLNAGRPVAGIINAAARTRYIVAAAKSQGTDELAMFVTDDAITWHRAEFGNHKIEEDAYTVLEGTNYSIQVDVMNTDRFSNMGVLFTSNSNGTYFTRNIEHTNRDMSGLVDFEKIADVQGIALVNVVDNWEEVETSFLAEKKVISKISFDDGRTFQSLKVKDEDLHLHSVTAFKNIGRVFSSPAPGIVMGVGNTGSHLKDYEKGDLYVSDDAGVTWRLGLEKPHKYEMGNKGAVVAAIRDDGKPTKKIQYSINHGKDWESVDLGQEIVPYLLTTTPDSSSLKFLLFGNEEDGSKSYVFAIDFEGLHERECKESDFEDWPARLDKNGEPSCLMGHKQFYRRRKSDANCFITENLFKTPTPEFKPCKCTVEDFECDYNFVRSEDRKECIPAAPLKAPEGTCKNEDDTFKGPSGWRLIPGNACILEGGEALDREIDRSCKDAIKVPTGDAKAVTSTPNYIDAEMFGEFFYLERAGSSSGEDETIIMRTSGGSLYVTHDHGKTWTHELPDVKIQQIAPHRYLNDRAFFLTDGKKQYLTINRAETFDSFTAPADLNPYGLTLSFHAIFKDYMIWTGTVDCDHGQCPKNSYFTKHRGDSWEILLRTVEKCEFMAREDRKKDNDDLIFCDQHEAEDVDGQRMLLTSNDFFDTSATPLKNIIDFATMAEFIIVATRNPENENSLKVDASVDGVTFADADFPSNLEVPVQLAYTVLDSSTHSVFLHVTANNKQDQSYGAIIKSNSNGTSYVLSLRDVNRNNLGYVDFEKLQGLEGVALANIVSNTKDVEKGSEKKLKSMITHNDGARWTLILPPAKDSEGKSHGCRISDGKPTEKCALHLHGYTERRDPRDTFASASAIGLMFGVGNVGEYLGSKADTNTYFSRDGGISWKEVKKGSYLWKFGDQGSVLVLAEESKPTQQIYFSVDEGETWESYQFTDKEVIVQGLSTVPSDTSKNFLIWGKEVSSSKLVTINLDFSGLRDRTCNLDENVSENEDYYLWEPKHPSQKDNCLFGHVEQYHRKKPESHCWNDWSEAHVHRIARNCTCTREDYECDYNYEPQNDGSCALVPGLPKPNAIEHCTENPDAVEYWEPTGFRRIPLTTCVGGLNLDHLVPRPCPNHEEEFERKHGVSGLVIFFAIIIPFAIAAGVGYWVYINWNGSFGQIRLGEGGSQSFSSMFSRGSGGAGESPLITIPVMVIAGTVAAVKVLPLLVMSLWRSVSGYVRIPGRGGPRPYATRSAFAARRGDYTNVVDDEDELLGDDEFEDEEEEAGHA